MGCSCVYYSGVFVTGAFQRRALSTLFPKGLVSPSPFYQYHRNRRRVDASVSTAAKEQQQLRSPDLVALEYADLNLTHNVSQACIWLFHPFYFVWGKKMLFLGKKKVYIFDVKLISWVVISVLQELGHVRIRQHVNPLSSSLAVCDSDGVLIFLSCIYIRVY